MFTFASVTLVILWCYRAMELYHGKMPANFTKDLANYFEWVYHLLFVAHPIFGAWVVFSVMVGGVALGRYFGAGTKVADAHDFSSLSQEQKR